MTKPIISERIIKPGQCALAFGIPLSRDDFDNDREHPNKGFAKKFHGNWNWYVREFAGFFDLFRPHLIELGVKLHPALTFEKFEALFSQEFDVIILFSHWEREAIEFHDGLVEYPKIVERIPGGFDRILDLSVCHPDPLVTALRRDRPKCLIRHIKYDEEGCKDELIPRYWLAFYHALFTHLSAHDLTYLDAVEDVIVSFLKKI